MPRTKSKNDGNEAQDVNTDSNDRYVDDVEGVVHFVRRGSESSTNEGNFIAPATHIQIMKKKTETKTMIMMITTRMSKEIKNLVTS